MGAVGSIDFVLISLLSYASNVINGKPPYLEIVLLLYIFLSKDAIDVYFLFSCKEVFLIKKRKDEMCI